VRQAAQQLAEVQPVPLPKIYEKEETGMKPGIKSCYAVAVAVMLALAGAVSARAQDISQAEKERALQYLESTKKGVLDATKGLSDAQ
jgi:hypothetical protein